MEPSVPKNHEDHIAGKGHNSMTHKKLGTQVHSDAASDENPGCKSSSGQGMEEARDDPGMEFGQSKEQKRRSFWKHRKT